MNHHNLFIKIFNKLRPVERKLFHDFIIDDLLRHYEYVPMSSDVKNQQILDTVRYYKNKTTLYQRGHYGSPYHIIFPNNLGTKGYIIHNICEWIGADLDGIYYYADDAVIKLDRMDILGRGVSNIYSKKTSYKHCDSRVLLNLLESGMLILNVYSDQYLLFFKNNKGNFVGISTMNFGLTPDLDEVEEEDDEEN